MPAPDDHVRPSNFDVSTSKTSSPRPDADEPWEDGSSRTGQKLGSLAQQARGSQLTQARWLLIVIGLLTVIVNTYPLLDFDKGFRILSVQEFLEKEIRKAGLVVPPQLPPGVVAFATLLLAIPIGVGVLFLVFAALIRVIPLVATIGSLTLYVLAHLVLVLLNPQGFFEILVAGFIFKIIIVVCLIKAIQAASAYEKERREQAEFQVGAEA